MAWTNTEKGFCVNYSTKEIDCCYNANMLGAELFARLFYLTKENKYKELACKMTDFTIAYQKKSGLWNYSINLKSGKERTQIDFHQGYVLDSIHYVIKYAGENEIYQKALKKKGLHIILKNNLNQMDSLFLEFQQNIP